MASVSGKTAIIRCLLFFALISLPLLGGCASANHIEQRPFFQQEYGLESHGRKTLLDHIIELDPGGFDVNVKPEFMRNPPARIGVLPFSDEGNADLVVDRIRLTFRSKQERYNWSWTDAQRLRRAMQTYLSQREFLVANLYAVDAVIQDRGIGNMAQLQGVSPLDLGDWLDVDAVVYGKVLHYEAFYLGMVAAWQVAIQVRVVSTHTGETLIEGTGSRWDVSASPALTPQDIVINSAENILHLRDINLARAEEEACREVVKRIPLSEKLISDVVANARQHEMRVEARRAVQQFDSAKPEPYPILYDPGG